MKNLNFEVVSIDNGGFILKTHVEKLKEKTKIPNEDGFDPIEEKNQRIWSSILNGKPETPNKKEVIMFFRDSLELSKYVSILVDNHGIENANF